MKSGDLMQRVLFQRRLDTQNAMGEAVVGYVDAFYEMCAVEPLNGRELFQAQQTQAEVDTRVRLRWRRGISELMRVVHIASYESPQLVDVYDVRAVIDQRARHYELHLLCVRRPSDQGLPARPPITADMDTVTSDNGP